MVIRREQGPAEYLLESSGNVDMLKLLWETQGAVGELDDSVVGHSSFAYF